MQTKDGRKEGWTDMTKITGAFHNYAMSPKTYGFKYRIDNLAPPHVKFEITSKLEKAVK
jgi:hypothetical protein